MITREVTRSLGFLKTTAIGGIFFLLPLVVIGVLLGQVYSVVAVVMKSLSDAGADQYVAAESAGGYVMLFLAAIALLVLACFVCGVLAQRSLARNFTQSIEKYLLMLFPRYAIFKEQISGNIRDETYKNRLQPVLVRFNDHSQVAFEVAEAPFGHEAPFNHEAPSNHEAPFNHTSAPPGAAEPPNPKDLVAVYLPGSPDPWAGTVVLVTTDQITPLATDFLTACGTFEQLGSGMRRLIETAAPQNPNR